MLVMRPFLTLLDILIILFLGYDCAGGQLHPSEPARYQALPSLREQAEILDGWRQERIDALPGLMKKYGVDAWLVRCRFMFSA